MQIDRELARIAGCEPQRDYAVVRCVQAWCDLSTCRPIGMAVGAIPVTAIWAWCDRRGLDSEAADIVEHVIRQLDVERSEREAATAAAEKALGPGRGKASR